MIRKWQDNAFWENNTKTRVTGILVVEEEDGKTTSNVVHVSPGVNNDNPDWIELMDQVGEEKITQNTEERLNRKKREREAQELKEKERAHARNLQELFNAKLAAFEVDEIKQSKNRALKSRLRRAKSIVEVNVYAMMIVMEQLENESTTD